MSKNEQKTRSEKPKKEQKYEQLRLKPTDREQPA